MSEPIVASELFAAILTYLDERPSDDTEAKRLFSHLMIFFTELTPERSYIEQYTDSEWL